MSYTPLRPVWIVGLILMSLVSGVREAPAQERLKPFVREPRSVRSRPFDTEHIRLDLKFDFDAKTVQGRATERLRPLAALRQLELDAELLQIERVALLGSESAEQELKFAQHETSVSIELGREFQRGEPLELVIDYRVVEPKRGIHFVLPDRHEPERGKLVWTHCQPDDARCWFPCFDSPNERVTSEIIATVPEDLFVLSNGTLVRTKHNDDGTQTTHWTQEQTHPPYLMSVVAGRFEPVQQSWDGIPIISYVPPDRVADAERSFGKTAAMMAYYSEKIGYRYPWPKYAQICCDEFGGGMEHTSATTLTLDTLHDEQAHLDRSSDGLVAHELVHHWWGDLVTCKDWGELWLNESFATYFATLWTEQDLGWDEATWERRDEAEQYFGEDSGRYRRPIVTYRYPESIQMFDRHSYPKGGRVLHMLRYVLGDDDFWRALNHYVKKHEYGVVETADLRVAIEEATGQGLNWFFDQWVHRGGHPEYEVSYNWDEADKLVRVTVKQTQKVDELTPLFRMPVEIDLVVGDSSTRHKVTVAKAEETFTFSLPERPRRVVFDPRDWILKKLTFKKSKQELLDQLKHDPNTVPRAQAAEQLADYRPDSDARDALMAAAKEDAFWGVREAAVKSLARFPGDAVRDALVASSKDDARSNVRRAAMKGLVDFPGDTTNNALRDRIANDPSYYVAADALTTLAKVDPDRCRPDLLAALDRTSDREVILAAACNSLAAADAVDALPRLKALLENPGTPRRRAAIFDALAAAGNGDPAVTKLLAGQLNDSRDYIRRAAAIALGATGDRGAIEPLLATRAIPGHPRTLAAIDQAVTKLRDSGTVSSLRREVETLQGENSSLEKRVEQLEKAATPNEAAKP
ncbi:MAG: HEAT repeat domain-containing protein [Pirellulales bacterium]|nr:HEAT repeat domain-containing protein [Pirellulales bacterium]